MTLMSPNSCFHP